LLVIIKKLFGKGKTKSKPQILIHTVKQRENFAEANFEKGIYERHRLMKSLTSKGNNIVLRIVDGRDKG
jgi:hypothetical protein